MRLTHLTEDEFRELKNFSETGERFHSLKVTDSWIEDSLSKTVKEIDSLRECADCSFNVAREWSSIVAVARELSQAWNRGEDLTLLFEGLKVALRPKKQKKKE